MVLTDHPSTANRPTKRLAGTSAASAAGMMKRAHSRKMNCANGSSAVILVGPDTGRRTPINSSVSSGLAKSKPNTERRPAVHVAHRRSCDMLSRNA